MKTQQEFDMPVRILFSGSADAGETYTPATGTAERNAILKVLFLDFHRNGGEPSEGCQNIRFVVHHLRIKGRWILVNATPTRNGKPVGGSRWALIQKSGNRYENRRYHRAISPHLSDFN